MQSLRNMHSLETRVWWFCATCIVLYGIHPCSDSAWVTRDDHLPHALQPKMQCELNWPAIWNWESCYPCSQSLIISLDMKPLTKSLSLTSKPYIFQCHKDNKLIIANLVASILNNIWTLRLRIPILTSTNHQVNWDGNHGRPFIFTFRIIFRQHQ